MKGILRLLKSSKGIAALASIMAAIGVQFIGLEEEFAVKLAGWIIIVAVAYIGGVTVEDSAEKFRKGDSNAKPDDSGGAGSS